MPMPILGHILYTGGQSHHDNAIKGYLGIGFRTELDLILLHQQGSVDPFAPGLLYIVNELVNVRCPFRITLDE